MIRCRGCDKTCTRNEQMCQLCELLAANKAGIILIPVPASLSVPPIEIGALECLENKAHDF